jgi:Fe-S-cluster containining protein
VNNTQSIFLLHEKNEPPGCSSVTLPLEMPELTSVKIGFYPGHGSIAELVPMARELLDTMLSRRTAEMAAKNLHIACHKGCHAACCHYLISVSIPEALMKVAETIALPENQRVQIINYCKNTAQHIQQQMSRRNLTAANSVSRENLLAWYRELNIPCPMLKDNCCTIYDRRPLVCRECLAVGSPEQCRNNTEVQTHIRLPIHPANILMQLTQQLFGGDSSIITLPGIFDWFTEKARLYQQAFPRKILVQKFVNIATNN